MDRIDQRPTRYTNADHMRMRAADERHAAMLRRQARKVWVYRAVYLAGIIITFTMFYRSI